MSKTPFSLLMFLLFSFQMKLSIAILLENQQIWKFQNRFALISVILRFLKVLAANSLKKIFVVVSSTEFKFIFPMSFINTCRFCFLTLLLMLFN